MPPPPPAPPLSETRYMTTMLSCLTTPSAFRSRDDMRDFVAHESRQIMTAAPKDTEEEEEEL